jgi:hypothetical protein
MRGSVRFRVLRHRTKLDDGKLAPPQADSRLLEKNRPRRRQANGKHDEGDERQANHQPRERNKDRHNAPDNLLRCLHIETVSEDQCAGIEPVQGQPAQQPLHQEARIFNHYPAEPKVKQFANRH